MQNIKYNIAIPINVIKDGKKARNLIIIKVSIDKNAMIVRFTNGLNFTKN